MEQLIIRVMEDKKKERNIIIGNKIMIARQSFGLTRQTLGDKIEVTNEQIRKYELGKDRVSFDKLCDIADILGRDLNYFRPDNNIEIVIDTTASKEHLHIKLMRNFRKIKSKRCQESIINIVKKLADKE